MVGVPANHQCAATIWFTPIYTQLFKNQNICVHLFCYPRALTTLPSGPLLMMQLNGKRSLALLMVMPVLLLVELGIGWGIFINAQQTARIQSDNNKLDIYLVTNTKYIAAAESAQRGYLFTADIKFYENYIVDIREWAKNEEYYHTLPAAVKHKEVDQIELMSRQKISDMSLSIRRYNQDGKDSSIAIGKSGYSNGLADSIGSKSTRLRYQTGNAILTERNKEYALISAFFTVIAFLIVFSLILAGLTYIAFRDYTRSLEATVKSLEEANETLLKYNFNSYHSLKTPLRNINGFLQLLEKKYKAQFDEEAKEYMNFIIEGVKQLSIIIDDMRHKFLESGDGDKGNG